MTDMTREYVIYVRLPVPEDDDEANILRIDQAMQAAGLVGSQWELGDSQDFEDDRQLDIPPPPDMPKGIPAPRALVSAAEAALSLLAGTAATEDRDGHHNAAMNVRQVEQRLKAALGH